MLHGIHEGTNELGTNEQGQTSCLNDPRDSLGSHSSSLMLTVSLISYSTTLVTVHTVDL